MKHRMTRALCLVLPALFCLSCSGQSDQKDDLRPYSDPRLVPVEPFVHAFAHLQEQGQAAFRQSVNREGRGHLDYTDDYQYDDGRSFHVELMESYWPEELGEWVFFTGHYTTSADPETKRRFTVRPFCGLWGDGDYNKLHSAEMFDTAIDGCGADVYPYHLVYPMVYADPRDDASLPEDFERFLTLSVFERMMVPVEAALQELGEYVDADMLVACPA